MYCPSDKQYETICICRDYFSKRALKDIFVFTSDVMKRYQGSWHIEQRTVFQNYVFVDSEDIEYLMKELMIYKKEAFLSEEVNISWLVTEEQKLFLKGLCGKRQYHIEMSKGYISEGYTCIISGPLKGKEQLISKIDRHKRMARLYSPLENYEPRGLWAGLEITSKT